MTIKKNTKSIAWDHIGNLFWTKGRVSARPSTSEINLFLEGLNSDDSVAIVGASTKGLISEALKRGIDVTVIDFSARMCRDLSDSLNSGCKILQHDITDILPENLVGKFGAVISDRILNRFVSDEFLKAINNMLGLLSITGTVRTSIKIGLYPMDIKMIAEGERLKTLDNFYDATTRTIDFQASGDILDKCLVPHGEIDRDKLLKWYRSRGRESRYKEEDINHIISKTKFGNNRLEVVSLTKFPDANETNYYKLKSTPLF